MNQSFRIVSASLSFILISFFSFAQSKKKNQVTKKAEPVIENRIVLPAIAFNGETLPTVTLFEFPVIAERTFKSEKEKQAYLKLKRDLKKA